MIKILHHRPAQPQKSGVLPGEKSRHPALPVVLVLLSAAVSIPTWRLADDPFWWPAIGIGTATASLCLIYLLHAVGFEWQSGPVAYLVLVWLFHFPLTLLVSLETDPDVSLPRAVLSWLERGDWYRASAYTNICVAGFVLGCVMARRRCGARGTVVLRPSLNPYLIGMVTAGLATCDLVSLFWKSGGTGVFAMSYGSLYDTLFSAEFTFACYMVTVGVTIAILNSTPAKRWLPIALQCAVTIATLLTGARQYALIGVLVLVVVSAKVGLKTRPVFLLCGGMLALLLISIVGSSRNNGVLQSIEDIGDAGPTVALAEMGGSLQTVSLAIGWIGGGDRLQWGGSYWLPIERGIGLFVPGLRSDLQSDPRATSQVLLSRVGGLGGSVVAESFYNFSLFGAAIFIVFGYLLGYLELKARSASALAWGGVVLYALTLEVRNWFISVPAMIAIGTIPIVVGLFFAGRQRGRKARAIPFQEGKLRQRPSTLTFGPANNS